MKMRKLTIIMAAMAIVLAFGSCKKDEVAKQESPTGGEVIENAVTDIDGNTYRAVKLGEQVWMAENLRTTRYADGTSISLGSITSTTTAYLYYPNDNSGNVNTYGYLYNWKAVMGNSSSSSSNPSGVQGICPNGWHVPSDAEWTQLTTYVKSQPEYVCEGCSGTDDERTTNCIAKALASTSGWKSYDYYGTPGNDPSSNNATGFAAVPAGYYIGSYYNFGLNAYFWSATQDDSDYAYYRYLYYHNAGVGRNYYSKYHGFSVRCLRN
ncbi:MAG: fibrobacter succinogenes major paralogous domain-containing protein [Bacteroidales bacterium]|nr:fibrobacter succinogenes major paralogous domain-containing protein [Bacteroidales bacterium]